MDKDLERLPSVREKIQILQADKQNDVVTPKQFASKRQSASLRNLNENLRKSQINLYSSEITKSKEKETSVGTKPCNEYRPSKTVLKGKPSEQTKSGIKEREARSDVSSKGDKIQPTTVVKTIETVGQQKSKLKTKSYGENVYDSCSKTSFLTEISKIDFLMIGKTGNGKSALGNTILKQSVFQSLNSSTSVTKEVTSAKANILDKVVSVFDAPGVGDTDGDVTESNARVLDALTAAISANPDGYHAFLLVLRFGERFKKEDAETIAFLKKIFGEDFVRKFCILVMTFGDHFEKDNQGESFQEWLSKQKGHLEELVKECNNRVVLFDNKTTDELKQERQLQELFSFVEDLVLENCRYTNTLFDLAKSTRNKILMESNIIFYEQQYNAILLNLTTIQQEEKLKVDTTLLNAMLQNCQDALQDLIKENSENGCLTELIDQFKCLEETLNIEINVRNRFLAYKRETDLVQKVKETRGAVAIKCYQINAEIQEKEKLEFETLYKQERRNVAELENKIRDLRKKSIIHMIKKKLDSYSKK
ncbi:GTPase IMAP family member 1 [Biomphalaria glabrata]|nr:GTPase IMAP family member 1-like; partial [Biomphalaria glabrata]